MGIWRSIGYWFCLISPPYISQERWKKENIAVKHSLPKQHHPLLHLRHISRRWRPLITDLIPYRGIISMSSQLRVRPAFSQPHPLRVHLNQGGYGAGQISGYCAHHTRKKIFASYGSLFFNYGFYTVVPQKTDSIPDWGTIFASQPVERTVCSTCFLPSLPHLFWLLWTEAGLGTGWTPAAALVATEKIILWASERLSQ